MLAGTDKAHTKTESELELLWNEHNRTVHRFVAKRMPSGVVDDIVADTFVDAARGLARGCDVQIPWLMTVARRRMADHWRRTERLERLDQRLRNIRQSHLAEVEYENGFELAIANLAPRQRQALILRYSLGFSLPAIAEELGTTYRATEALLARGKRTVEKQLTLA